MSAGFQHYGYYLESRSLYGNDSQELPSPPSLSLTTASVAYVGDDATMGYTSPIAGTRFRFEATPTFGSLNYQTYLADARRYAYLKPFTLAIRTLAFGRFGTDGDSPQVGSLFLGDPTLVRGYAYDSFDAADCQVGPGSLGSSACPQFDRLLGSRLAVANIEFRIPVFGARGLGLIESMFPPLEITPFVDAGVAWTGSSAPVWSFDRNSADRTPVMSAGITSRLEHVRVRDLRGVLRAPVPASSPRRYVGIPVEPRLVVDGRGMRLAQKPRRTARRPPWLRCSAWLRRCAHHPPGAFLHRHVMARVMRAERSLDTVLSQPPVKYRDQVTRASPALDTDRSCRSPVNR
jgi:hypothetical protein